MEYKSISMLRKNTPVALRKEFNTNVIPVIQHNFQIKSSGLIFKHKLEPISPIDKEVKTIPEVEDAINKTLIFIWNNLVEISAKSTVTTLYEFGDVSGNTGPELRQSINKVLSNVMENFKDYDPKSQYLTSEIMETVKEAISLTKQILTKQEENKQFMMRVLDIKARPTVQPLDVDDSLKMIIDYLEKNIDITKRPVTKEEVKASLDRKEVPTIGIHAKILHKEISNYATTEGISLPKNLVKEYLNKLGIKYIRVPGYNTYHTLNFRNKQKLAYK